MSTLYVETDWDFSLMFNGELYSDMYFEMNIEAEDLDKIVVMGPFGDPNNNNAKSLEFEEGIAEVKKNPFDYFSNTGGNRGIEWYP
jgi:hypothetical protein